MAKDRITATIMVKDTDKYNTAPKLTKDVRLTVNIPDHVQENIRQQKINRIYDILNPDTTN